MCSVSKYKVDRTARTWSKELLLIMAATWLFVSTVDQNHTCLSARSLCVAIIQPLWHNNGPYIDTWLTISALYQRSLCLGKIFLYRLSHGFTPIYISVGKPLSSVAILYKYCVAVSLGINQTLSTIDDYWGTILAIAGKSPN